MRIRKQHRVANARVKLGLAAMVAATTTVTNVSIGQEAMMDKSADKMQHAGEMSKKDAAVATKIGLEGYCPVCIIEHGKWEKGSVDIQATFDGVAYQFPTESIKRVFEADPQKYVPVINGDCIVCLEKSGKRVPGSVQHAARHDQRLYLFPSEAEKKTFLDNPQAYAQTDLALDGECVVCLARSNKHVPGAARHTVVHEGLRYQFPSEKEADVFRGSPGKFLSMVSVMAEKDSMSVSAGKAVKLVGRSGCAACEFGVTPISNPDELGLAVVGKDGQVTVVEGAHETYPVIYKERFAEKQLAVEGKIVKTEGKIRWLQPTSLEVLN